MSIVMAGPEGFQHVSTSRSESVATMRSKSLARRIHVAAGVGSMALAWVITLVVATSIRVTAVLTFALALTGATMTLAWWRNNRHPLLGSISVVASRHVMASSAYVGVAVAVAGTLQPAPFGVSIGGAALAAVFATAARTVVDRIDLGERPDLLTAENLLVLAGDRHAEQILDLIDEHAVSGWRPSVLVGPCRSTAVDRDVPWGGDAGCLTEAALEHDVSVIVASADSLRSDDVRMQLLVLKGSGVDVHVDAGLEGIDYRHVRVAPLGHNPFLSLESTHMPGAQRFAKRAVDIMLSMLLIILTAPILLVAALAVKLGDGGPVLFRQERVGEGGQTFGMLKLRTMHVDAEARLAEVRHLNERDGGPLFKLSKDPRVTPVGRLLRATSLDELPQLFQVLRGEMSLVGPRPALPSEAAVFDDRLAHRQDVKPGITGLWQVEARDSASFNSYRRLDLFYVENWSLLLDFAILAHTVPAVLGRGWRAVRRHDAPSKGLVTS